MTLVLNRGHRHPGPLPSARRTPLGQPGEMFARNCTEKLAPRRSSGGRQRRRPAWRSLEIGSGSSPIALANGSAAEGGWCCLMVAGLPTTLRKFIAECDHAESRRYLSSRSDHFSNFGRLLEVIERMGFDPPLGSFHQELRVIVLVRKKCIE
jgi:hypothetical protein